MRFKINSNVKRFVLQSTIDARGGQEHEMTLDLVGGAGGSVKIVLKVEREMRAQDAARVSYKLTQRLKAAKQQFTDPGKFCICIL